MGTHTHTHTCVVCAVHYCLLVSVLAIYWDDDAPTSALRAADNKHTHEHTRARTHTPNNMYVYNASSVGVSTLYRPQPPHRTGHSTTSKRRYHTCTTCVSWSYIGGTKYMVFQADGYKTNCMWWCSCNYLAHVRMVTRGIGMVVLRRIHSSCLQRIAH